ncbi:MAG: DUF2188 domain-containing protein [archaeon]|nr:DUF2188 domain-containing protein [archaeon]
MGLFRKKKDEDADNRVREPVREYSREDYIQIRAPAKKTTSTRKSETKGDGKKMAETTKKETTKKTAEKKETKPTTEKKEPVKKAPAKTETKPAAEKKDKPKTWHITKREDVDKWQVKAEGNEKATKLFRTKAEAPECVESLQANAAGSKLVSHKKDGKFQKKN